METLCRVCGSQGTYDIFGKIPRFLHSDYARRDCWKQPISKMVTDVTGIAISKNDGLPERICALCISYLKHSVNFRNRAVETRLSLLSAAFVTMKDPCEDFGIVCDNDEADEEGTDNLPETPKETENEKATETPSTVKPSRKVQRFFDYEETTFVEDDMTQFDEMNGIEINHPEVFRERKCGFCLKRFMLEDTYDGHLDDCIFRTLIEFVKDSNYIVRLKDEVAISNHEFIRRMVFIIQRVNKAIRVMHLPAQATLGLVDERPVGSVGRIENTQVVNQDQRNKTPQELQGTPKNNQFFLPVDLFKYPPPPLPANIRNGQPNGNSSPFTPNRPPVPYKPNGSVQLRNQQFINNNSPRFNRSSSGSVVLQTPSPVNSSASDSSGMRRVVCKFCDKSFLTITHLDGHLIKEHT